MPLSFANTVDALRACLRAGITPLLVGSPGIGKTAAVRAACVAHGLPLHELLASNCEPTDLAGLPYVVDGALRRALLPPLRACVDAPGVLFLDELTSVPPSVQAPLLRLLLERRAGDVALHPGSVVVGAANRPEECPGGVELSAATVNRLVVLADFAPTIGELQAWFGRLGEPDSRLRAEATDFAATLALHPELIELSPPRAALDAGTPFASPRAWEHGLRALAAHAEEHDRYLLPKLLPDHARNEVGPALLAGAVGEARAAAYLAVRAHRAHLPDADEVLRAPARARVPAERAHQVAALGLVARVARRDAWAAWVYAARLAPEIAAACARQLADGPPPAKSRWQAAGEEAQRAVLAQVQRTLAGAP